MKSATRTSVDPHRLVELVKLDPSIKLDMRYASNDNFTGRVLYSQARAFMAAAAAEALIRANASAKAEGFVTVSLKTV